jgi:hypothetical protein
MKRDREVDNSLMLKVGLTGISFFALVIYS